MLLILREAYDNDNLRLRDDALSIECYVMKNDTPTLAK